MIRKNIILSYVLLLILQILLCNYLQLSPYVTLSVLPLLILMLPTRVGALPAMIIAFISALSVDFLAEGVVGINALALVPVALLRQPIIRLVFGDEIYSRQEDISIRRHGLLKMTVALILAQSTFLIIYVWADAAGARSFSFCLVRFILSLLSGVLVSLPLSRTLSLDEREL